MPDSKPARLPFVLAATDQGTLIVNRLDYHVDPELNSTYGLGIELLDTANYEAPERDLVGQLLQLRRKFYGDGVMVLDIGANIGAHTVAWSRIMTGWGQIVAFEAQEWLFYALSGNLAINNCLNAKAIHVAIGATTGTLNVPSLDPRVPCNFGGLELARMSRRDSHQPIGTTVDRDNAPVVAMLTLDSLQLSRVDLLKVDVEGMEIDVLTGARDLIDRCHPILFIEWAKSDQQELAKLVGSMGYLKLFKFGMNFLALHPTDPCEENVTFTEEVT